MMELKRFHNDGTKTVPSDGPKRFVNDDNKKVP